MRPTKRLFLFALTIFLLFGTVPAVNALAAGTDFDTAEEIYCDDLPLYNGEIKEVSNPDVDPAQEDYWKVYLVAGQELTIDIDALESGSSELDSLLQVYNEQQELIGMNDQSSKIPLNEDPYLEIRADVDGDYYLVISASTPGKGADTGTYSFLIKCSDQPTTSEFKWPDEDEVGDLIGSTGSDTGSLINITPADAESSLPFDLGVGPIADIEFDPSTNKLFVAINESPGSIITFDPATGDQDQTFSLVPVTETVPTVVALEAVENMLYGVQVDSSSGEEVGWVLVTMDITPGTAKLTDVVPFESPVRSLAYHPSEKILYGASGTDLIKIDLASSPVGIEEIPLTGLSVQIVALDFSHEDVLYGVDGSGNLFNVLDLSTGQAKIIGPIDVSKSAEGVSGLTFVVGESPDVDPIKTICSSTLTSSASASSATAAPKLSRFKRKKNPLHRAIGLFKFEGIKGETVTIDVKLEEEESADAVVEESSASELENPWLKYWKGKGRVFLGVRDSIPDVDFRVRKKDQLPLNMSATLPANGTYYVILIRPLLRFYKTDYCLTLESDFQDSKAADTFDVAWPNDDSKDDTASTSAEEKGAEPQTDEGAVVATGTANEFDGSDTDNKPTTLSLQATTTSDPAVESGGEEAPPAKTITEGESGGDTPEQSPAASLLNPDDEGDSEGDDEQLTEETTVEEPDEVVAAETAEDDRSAGADSDSENLDENETEGAESAEGNTSDVVEEKLTTEEAPTL